MAEVNVSVPNIMLSDLEKIVAKVKEITKAEDAEISFEFIIASLFPTSWKNIQADLNLQYTKGYIQGRQDKEAELRTLYGPSSDDDSDCYCE
jgi:hypothetical protein